MTPTLASPTGTAHETAACTAALDRVISGPWPARTGRKPHQPVPLPIRSEPVSPPEWYARPVVVSLAVTAACAAFWGAVALGVAAIV